jgi:predicted ATPase
MTVKNLYNEGFYVLTGGPGAGKTTLLNQLEEMGYMCVPEVAREIIREQMRIGGD